VISGVFVAGETSAPFMFSTTSLALELIPKTSSAAHYGCCDSFETIKEATDGRPTIEGGAKYGMYPL
jgi:hypothetical protein